MNKFFTKLSIFIIALSSQLSFSADAIAPEQAEQEIKSLQPETTSPITPDPFGLRASFTPRPSVDTLPDPDNIKDMRKYLEVHDLAGCGKSEYIVQKDVPQIFHYVWVGSELSNPTFRQNIINWKSSYRQREVVVWVDREELSEEMITWCQENKVRMINIFQSLPDDFWCGLKDPLVFQFTKVQPNYGEVSDILRYTLLYQFGGMYLDTDSTINYIYHNEDCNSEAPNGFTLLAIWVRGGKREITTSDCLLAKPKQEFIKRVINRIYENYKLSYEELVSVIQHFTMGKKAFIEGVFRAGPGCLNHVFKKMYGYGELHNFAFFRTKNPIASQFSWMPREVKPLTGEFSLKHRNQIITELLWDLRNHPDNLDLIKFDSWLNSPDIDREKVMMEVIEYIRRHHSESLAKIKNVKSLQIGVLKHLLQIYKIGVDDLLKGL